MFIIADVGFPFEGDSMVLDADLVKLVGKDTCSLALVTGTAGGTRVLLSELYHGVEPPILAFHSL